MSETEETEKPPHTIEAEDYEFTLAPHLAPRLLRLLSALEDADDPYSAVWYDADDREDIAEMNDRLTEQIRDQGYQGRL